MILHGGATLTTGTIDASTATTYIHAQPYPSFDSMVAKDLHYKQKWSEALQSCATL